MDIWGIFDKYLSDICKPYRITIRRDTESEYFYNEIRDVVKRHFPKSSYIEQVKRGVYYIVPNSVQGIELGNMIYNCIK